MESTEYHSNPADHLDCRSLQNRLCDPVGFPKWLLVCGAIAQAPGKRLDNVSLKEGSGSKFEHRFLILIVDAKPDAAIFCAAFARAGDLPEKGENSGTLLQVKAQGLESMEWTC